MPVERWTRWHRWSPVAAAAAVPVAVLVGIVLVVVLVLAVVPAVTGALPARMVPVGPDRLRALIAASAGQAHHGYAETAGSLGVPELPNLGEVTSMLNGTTRIRTWYGAPDRWRFDVLTAAGERDIYRTPDAGYVWDYGANLLTRFTGEPPLRLPNAGDLLPPQLARRVIGAAPGDRVEALPPRRVAGVAAAGLRLVPADPDTAVAHVDVWADPDTGLPVRVELTALGAGRPVLVSRFLEVTIGPPAGGAGPGPAAGCRPGRGGRA